MLVKRCSFSFNIHPNTVWCVIIRKRLSFLCRFGLLCNRCMAKTTSCTRFILSGCQVILRRNHPTKQAECLCCNLLFLYHRIQLVKKAQNWPVIWSNLGNEIYKCFSVWYTWGKGSKADEYYAVKQYYILKKPTSWKSWCPKMESVIESGVLRFCENWAKFGWIGLCICKNQNTCFIKIIYPSHQTFRRNRLGVMQIKYVCEGTGEAKEQFAPVLALNFRKGIVCLLGVDCKVFKVLR